MNPAENYNPTPEPSPGSILAALMRIEKKVDAIALIQSGQAGLVALQVTAPPFVEEKPVEDAFPKSRKEFEESVSRPNGFQKYIQHKGDDGWIEWKGGACPIDLGQKVDVLYRVGDRGIHVRRAIAYDWNHRGYSYDIVAYRPAQEQT